MKDFNIIGSSNPPTESMDVSSVFRSCKVAVFSVGSDILGPQLVLTHNLSVVKRKIFSVSISCGIKMHSVVLSVPVRVAVHHMTVDCHGISRLNAPVSSITKVEAERWLEHMPVRLVNRGIGLAPHEDEG